MAQAATSFEEPGYSADERKNGYVRLRIKVDGLKVQSHGVMGIYYRLRHIHPVPKGRNAEIQKPEFTERSLDVVVRGEAEKEMKGAQYRLTIRQLPYAVDPDGCYLTGSEGWLELFLKKQDKTQSWEKYIRDASLETYEG